MICRPDTCTSAVPENAIGKEGMMTSVRVAIDQVPWLPASEMFGQAAVYQGKPIIEAKTLTDRRSEGGGISYLLRFRPPEGKLIKVVAVAQSDEHIFNLSGGRATKAGQPAASSGGYSVNPKGQPHSAMIAEESTSLVIYTGEPDEVTSVEVIDIEPVPGE
jgi:hypothetical protein